MRAAWLFTSLLVACGSRSLPGEYYGDFYGEDGGTAGTPTQGGKHAGGGTTAKGGAPSGGGRPHAGGASAGGAFGGAPAGGGVIGSGGRTIVHAGGTTATSGGTTATSGGTVTGGSAGEPSSGGADPNVQSCNGFCDSLGNACPPAPMGCSDTCTGQLANSTDSCQVAGRQFFDCSSKALKQVTDCSNAFASITSNCAVEFVQFNACGGSMPNTMMCAEDVKQSTQYCDIVDTCQTAVYETFCGPDADGQGITCSCSKNGLQVAALPLPNLPIDLCSIGRRLNCTSF